MNPLIRVCAAPLLAIPVILGFSGCCDLLLAEAEALEREYARCETDEQCVVYSYFDDGYDEQPGLGNSCVPTFQCSVALAADADLYEFRIGDPPVADAGPFEVDADQTEQILAPGDATSLLVSCTPLEAGSHVGTLAIVTNAVSADTTRIPLMCEAS